MCATIECAPQIHDERKPNERTCLRADQLTKQQQPYNNKKLLWDLCLPAAFMFLAKKKKNNLTAYFMNETTLYNIQYVFFRARQFSVIVCAYNNVVKQKIFLKKSIYFFLLFIILVFYFSGKWFVFFTIIIIFSSYSKCYAYKDCSSVVHMNLTG